MGVKQKIKSMLRAVIQLFKEKEMVPIPQPVNSSMLLEGKTALITGGSSGIGYAMAEAFLNSGCKVIIAGRHEKSLQDAVEKLCRGGEIYCFRCK